MRAMDEGSLIANLVAFWLVCGFVGAVIGNARQAALAGFLLGLLLGPLGIVAAFMVDGRARCPTCAGRLHRGSRLCHHCGHAVPDPSETLQPARSEDLTREEDVAQRLRNRSGLPPRAG